MPTGIRYTSLKFPLRIVTIADSAYKGSDQDCLSVRGHLTAIAGASEGWPGGIVQVWDNLSKKLSLLEVIVTETSLVAN